ncbi:hypothetical protein HK101_000394 [Irineochytrium annulatum]|nr:hypothetical protein HK101_000394 [Irineochytrium annulatum]
MQGRDSNTKGGDKGKAPVGGPRGGGPENQSGSKAAEEVVRQRERDEKGKAAMVDQVAKVIDLTFEDKKDPFIKANLAPQAAGQRVADKEKARQCVRELVLLLKEQFLEVHRELEGQGESEDDKPSGEETGSKTS